MLARAVVAAPLWSSVLPPPPPLLLVLAGIGLIVTEATLAVTPWVPRLRRPGTVLAAGLHGAAVVIVSPAPLVALRLVVFGGTAVLLHAVSAGLVPAGGQRRPLRTCTSAAPFLDSRTIERTSVAAQRRPPAPH